MEGRLTCRCASSADEPGYLLCSKAPLFVEQVMGKPHLDWIDTI